MNLNFPATSLYACFYLNWDTPIGKNYRAQMFWDDYSIHLIKMNPDIEPRYKRYIWFRGIRMFYVNMAKSFGIEFVTIRLDKTDKKAFTSWAEEHIDDTFTLLAQINDQGYKVSSSYDPEGKCYIVAVTGKKDTPHNANKCYTSRSSDFIESVLLALYKHWGLAQGGSWDSIAQSQDNWG